MYRQLPSLQEYLLIEPERMAVDLFRRDAAGRWVLYPAATGQTLEIACLDLRYPVSALYEDVTLGARPAAQ